MKKMTNDTYCVLIRGKKTTERYYHNRQAG